MASTQGAPDVPFTEVGRRQLHSRASIAPWRHSASSVEASSTAVKDGRVSVPWPAVTGRAGEPTDATHQPGVPFHAVSLFADIRQSTAMTHRLGVGQMLKLLKDFFGQVESMVKDHGGSVRNYNGDGALALFSGQGRADCALAAAMSIQRFAEAFAATVGGYESHRPEGVEPLSLSVGVGMDDGEVGMDLVGDKQGPEVWAGVGAAAKLAEDARAGFIAMTEEVFAGLRRGQPVESFAWTPVEDKSIGGIIRRIHAICLHSPRPATSLAMPSAAQPYSAGRSSS